MSEGDSSKSIDDIFATVSRLGRNAGAAGAVEAATGRAIGMPDAEALANTLASATERAVQTSGMGRRTGGSAGDAAVSHSDDLLRYDGNSDDGEVSERPHQTAGEDRVPEGLEAAAAKAKDEEFANSNSVGGQHQAEGWSTATASVPARERASDGKPVGDDESTEEARWAEQAAAQLALLARHRADAEKRAHRAEQERRAAEQAAPLACARALTKKLASLDAAIEEERRASKLEAAQAVLGHDNAQSAQGACIDAVPEEEPRAAEESAASAAAEALEPARAEEPGRLAAVDEKKRQATEQAAALAAAEARERVQAEEETRPASVSEEEARQAAAREAPAEPLREPASDASPAPRTGVAGSRIDATPLQAQTLRTDLGRGRALMAVAMAAALVVAAGAVAAFMNRGSGEVGPATRGAFSGTAPERSLQMSRSPSVVSATESASSADEPARSMPVSAAAPSPQDVVRMVAAPAAPHSGDDDGRAKSRRTDIEFGDIRSRSK